MGQPDLPIGSSGHDGSRASSPPVFEPFSAEYLEDPYPFMAHARELTPAFYSPELDYWIVTRYHDIRRIFQSPASFSAANTLAPLTEPCPQAKAALKEGGYAPVAVLLNVDPPAHTRARRLANIGFTSKRVAAMEPFIRDVTRRFCDERLRDGRADLIRDLAWSLPAMVLFRILGVPEADVARVKEGARNRGLLLFGRAGEDEQVRAARELAAFWRYAWTLVEARAANPGDDFISALAQAHDGESEALTRREVATIVMIMFFAGNETTTGLIGNSFRRLLEDRPSWQAICRDPALIPNAIEEVLRIESSVITWRRLTREAVDIGGVQVPAQARLLLLLGSANRDPSVFPDPDRLDIRRANACDHLSFGLGPHACLGAPLARLEARVVLEEVSRRLPGLQLVPDTQYEYPKNVSLRGPASLPVTW